MPYRILSDVILIAHMCWIIFMLWGFALTVVNFVRLIEGQRCSAAVFLNRWIFRSIHAAGIVFVAILAVFRKYCPLTVLENFFRYRHDSSSAYAESFIVHYLEKIVYPDIDPMLIIVPTVAIALISLAVYLMRPPEQVRQWIRHFLAK